MESKPGKNKTTLPSDTPPKMSAVYYGENEMRLVESGVAAVAAVFRHGSEREKASVLLCMERYLDPYYGYALPHTDALFTLLEHEFFADHSDDFKDDILMYLSSYCSRPLTVLQQRRHEAASRWQTSINVVLAGL